MKAMTTEKCTDAYFHGAAQATRDLSKATEPDAVLTCAHLRMLHDVSGHLVELLSDADDNLSRFSLLPSARMIRDTTDLLLQMVDKRKASSHE